MLMLDSCEPGAPVNDHGDFATRLRGTGRWRRSLAADARQWTSAADSRLGDLDPVRQAAARFAAELDLTATVYELIHEGLPRGETARA